MRILFGDVSDLPADHNELDLVVFANINALVEALGIEQMADEAECHQRHVSLQAPLLTIFKIFFGLSCFLNLGLL